MVRHERLPQSQNLVSTLTTQSTRIRALSIVTSEGQDKIRGPKRHTSKRSVVSDVSSWWCDNTTYDITSVEEVGTRVGGIPVFIEDSKEWQYSGTSHTKL